jgi:cell wall-associated NlpC family hydrolase
MTHLSAEHGPAAIPFAAALLLIVILTGAVAGTSGQLTAACQVQPAASAAAASIPARYLADYQKAGAAYGIPWTVLAAVAGKVIAYAEAQLGKPYQWGATGPDAYDCSGLATMAYRAAGVSIPRTSQEQWQFGTRIPASAAQPGDLVFFAGADGTPQAPGHVGIVIGNDNMIEAYATGDPIRIATYGQPTSPPGDQVVVGVTRP